MELPYSGTSDVYKLAMDSNVGSPGFWVYELVQDDSSGGTILRDYSPPDCKSNFQMQEKPETDVFPAVFDVFVGHF